MISCTEFIPLYSELFKFLEEQKGYEEVRHYWDVNFDYTKSPLYRFLAKEGVRGCYSYWSITLNEEAADFTLYLNEKAGWFLLDMHRCPSKGRLLTLKDEIGVDPYPRYCLHCDYYRLAAEAVGLEYIYNFAGQDHAACSILIFDPKVFDGRVIVDENTEIMDRRASQNEYFHRSFHGSVSKGVDYVAKEYGEEKLTELLQRYTRRVLSPVYAGIKEKGLAAIEEKILDTYRKEHSEDAVVTECTENALNVTVKYCPGVKFLRESGAGVSNWYPMTTSVVMKTLAEDNGFAFTMGAYDEETGACTYSFRK